MRKQIKQTTKKKYEYELPQDGERLVIDVVSYGSLDSTKDGPNTISQEDITEKVKELIDQLKITSTAHYITNNIDMFQEIVIDAYTKAYVEKQRAFRDNNAMHAQEQKQIAQWGGYQKAFHIVRSRVAHAMYGKAGAQV